MIGGMIASIKQSHTKNPKPGAPAAMPCSTSKTPKASCAASAGRSNSPNSTNRSSPKTICVLSGVIDKRAGSEEANMIINEVIPIGEFEGRYTRGVRVRVMEASHGVKKLEMFYEILRGYPGECQFELLLCLADGRKISCRCEPSASPTTAEMRSRVQELLGAENFRLLTARPGPAATGGAGRRPFLRETTDVGLAVIGWAE